ncbi:hypothetical protein [Tautonia plasticadhaerens]|uniref:Uncharacterized protein n=1 Tax=Tautonia plasticadhaerens TaxID=2527974 RepID=A0A518GY22_9BACT|nr:hypothetical protein [Tautonia plasticadhaerens]QDV33489.1 hypothetical protein ElP_13620 [Tautonia plasticadhaerens]
MTRDVPETHPLHRLFRGITENTFHTELGIADPGLVGYVAGLLARFVPSQAIFKIRDGEGREVTQVSAMIAEAESSPDDDRRKECHRHVGDFTLFWTGVYPEALPKLREARLADHLVNFQEQGKRSYFLASTFEGTQAPVLRRLSAEFELCAFGLSLVRQEWERSDGLSDRIGLILES